MNLHLWTIIIYLVFTKKSFFSDCKNIEEDIKAVRKRRPKSLGSDHGGFEMFSMMDFPSKKLKIYAAHPHHRLLYSSKDLGQINGILTDKDVIDVDHITVVEPQQKPRNEELNNLVSNEDQDPTPPPNNNNYVPSNRVGFTHHTVRASDIEFFNNGVERMKPTRKQSSTRSVSTDSRRQFPVSKLSKDRLRKLMNRISTLLNEDAVNKPTKPVTKDCTDKTPSEQKSTNKANKIVKEDELYSNEDEEMLQNVGETALKIQGKKLAAEERNDVSSKQSNSLHSTVMPVTVRPTKKALQIEEVDESEEEEIFGLNKPFGKKNIYVFTDNSNNKNPGSTAEIKTRLKDVGTAKLPTRKAVATTKFTTIKPIETTVLPTTIEKTTLPSAKQRNLFSRENPVTKPSRKIIATTTKLFVRRKTEGKTKVKSPKKATEDKTKMISRIVNRYKPNAHTKTRIFKIREWRLPQFTIRKPCPLRADTLIRTSTNKVIAVDGTMMYIIGRTGVEVGPMPIKEYWPEVVGPINDAYVRPQDRVSIVFFKGRYAAYYNDKQLTDGPNDAAAIGIPRHLASFDAVSAWTGNRKTYFFKGLYYWRYNDAYHSFDRGYPRPIQGNWRGIPDNVDTAFIAPNQFMYFVKDGLIYKMEYYRANVRYRYPKRLFDSCYEFFM